MLVNKMTSLNHKIMHRNWEEALSLAFSLLVYAQPGDVVCITGPSRAGKTRLIKELCQLLAGDTRFEETGMLPTVVVEAVNTGPNGTFSSKSFTQRMLEAVKHPLFSVIGNGFDAEFSMQKIDRTTESTMRMALEKALVARGVKYLFIDEAQHARYVSKGAQGAYAVMDSWKCLAQSTGVVLVVVGAYPILQIIRNSPHLIGRKHQVHLPRYQYEEEDLREFAAIIAEYEKKLELCDSVGELKNHIEMIYAATHGCIGLLRNLLADAAAIARSKGVPISLKMLLEARLSDIELEEIKEEIKEGELLLRKSVKGNVYRKPDKKSSKKTSKQKPFKKKPKRRKPGHRTKEDV